MSYTHQSALLIALTINTFVDSATLARSSLVRKMSVPSVSARSMRLVALAAIPTSATRRLVSYAADIVSCGADVKLCVQPADQRATCYTQYLCRRAFHFRSASPRPLDEPAAFRARAFASADVRYQVARAHDLLQPSLITSSARARRYTRSTRCRNGDRNRVSKSTATVDRSRFLL